MIGRRRRGLLIGSLIALTSTLSACGDDSNDSAQVVEEAFEQLDSVGSTYEIALSDSNAFRSCVDASGGDAAALQDCADNSGDAISGPDTVAALVANRAEPLRQLADDAQATDCVAQVDLLDARLAAWFEAATNWRTTYEADATDPALTADLIDAVGDRQHEAETAWPAMREACNAEAD